MLRWLRRTFWPSDMDVIEMALEKFGRGERAYTPTTITGETTTQLGTLSIPSRTIVMGDCLYVPSLIIPDLPDVKVTIWENERHFSRGGTDTLAYLLRFGAFDNEGEWRPLGNVGIDSACVVIADQQDYETHWTDTGPDRIGVISTARDDRVLKLLTKRFKLRTRRQNNITANVIGPVSESLEQEIRAFLKSIPAYAKFPYMHFSVRTNNSFDRANESRGFLPIGNAPTPLMFVGTTGYGDGLYEVQGRYVGNILREVKITFIEEDPLGRQRATT